ncbi:hypothetical protein ABZP36_009679 [Zizania latifolia]
MEALGLRSLATSVNNSRANANSQKPNIQTNKKNTDEGSDSSEYLPRAEEGQEEQDECVNTSLEKVSSQSCTNFQEYRAEEHLNPQPDNNGAATVVQGEEEHHPPSPILDWSVFDEPSNAHEDEVSEQLEAVPEGK